MSSNWAEMQLGDFLELKRGYDLPKTVREEGDVPVVSSSGPTGTHSVSMAKAPGVVTGRYGTIGQVFYVEEDYWPLNTTLYVKDFKGNDPLFVYFLLKTIKFFEYSDKAAVPGVNRNHLHKAIIRVPTDLAAQHDIAINLWNIDIKIELNRQINQTLEHIAQAIFKSWFVDFDPVKAKIAAKQEWEAKRLTAKDGGNDENAGAIFVERAAMRTISGKTDEELDAHGSANVAGGRMPGATDQLTPEHLQHLTATAALFPDELEDSELGPIPKGWKIGSVDEQFNLTMGQSPPGETYNEIGEGFPFYQGRTDFGFRFPTRRVYCTAPSRMADKGDTLISVRAPVGDINMAAEKCCVGRGVAAARHKSGSRSYTFYFMQSLHPEFSRFEAGGTVFGSISKKDFSNLRCMICNPRLIAKLEQRMFPIDQAIEINEQQANTLIGLRDSLLPKLLSGEITVSETSNTAEAVA